MGATISVAMATYNGEKFILDQLHSLARQTHTPLELVVSDDGSTDGTLALVEAFAKTAPFAIRVLPSHKRLGFADNFLHAAEQCRGDLIAFCDQDDEWLPEKLARSAERIAADGSLLAIHPLTVVDTMLKPTGFVWTQEIASDHTFEPLELSPYCIGFGNTMLFDRAVLDLIPREKRPRQPDKRSQPLSHDHWVYSLCAALGRVSHLAEPLILYRQHESSTFGVKPRLLTNRLYSALVVPEGRFREEAEFNRTMASLLAGVDHDCARFSSYAGEAAKAYLERARLCSDRLQVYMGEDLRHRLSAFKRTRSARFYKPWFGSTIKELVLGVSGLSRLVGGVT